MTRVTAVHTVRTIYVGSVIVDGVDVYGIKNNVFRKTLSILAILFLLFIVLVLVFEKRTKNTCF